MSALLGVSLMILALLLAAGPVGGCRALPSLDMAGPEDLPRAVTLRHGIPPA